MPCARDALDNELEEQTSCPDTRQTGLGSLGRLPADKGQPAARNRIFCVLWENVGIEGLSPPARSDADFLRKRKKEDSVSRMILALLILRKGLAWLQRVSGVKTTNNPKRLPASDR
ncbi:hypothetical protein E5288_WYG012255 [Bos mutus]|uniref:Uncharacterized protein n=1 Tax=Bos mutus TaxID=72004 RepID=A0A6B0RLM6_9CETA|nr:hypothetical protein [Bos mutus]